MLVPQYPLETFLRGTLAYLGILTILRVVMKRQVGSIASSDILVTVLIADAIQNGMAGNYKSVPDGLLLVATIVMWDYVIDWLAYRSHWVQSMLVPQPLPLVLEGKMLRRNMRKELITEQELMTKLRQEGVQALDNVKAARMESNGEISVIKQEE